MSYVIHTFLNLELKIVAIKYLQSQQNIFLIFYIHIHSFEVQYVISIFIYYVYWFDEGNWQIHQNIYHLFLLIFLYVFWYMPLLKAVVTRLCFYSTQKPLLQSSCTLFLLAVSKSSSAMSAGFKIQHPNENVVYVFSLFHWVMLLKRLGGGDACF